MKCVRSRDVKYGKRSVYYNDVTKSYIKYHDYCTGFNDIKKREWYKEHCRLMDKYYPGFILSRSCSGNRIILEYKEIEGNRICGDEDWEPTEPIDWSYRRIHKLYRWILSEVDKTWPYTHGDWALTNILVQSNGEFKMVDFDTFSNTSLPTMDHVINQIHTDLIKGFGKRKFTRYLNKYFCKISDIHALTNVVGNDIKDFLTYERSALIEHLKVLGKDENTPEIVRLLHVIDYLSDRQAGNAVPVAFKRYQTRWK